MIDIAVPNISDVGNDKENLIFFKHIVVAVSCSDFSVKVIQFPLDPPTLLFAFSIMTRNAVLTLWSPRPPTKAGRVSL